MQAPATPWQEGQQNNAWAAVRGSCSLSVGVGCTLPAAGALQRKGFGASGFSGALSRAQQHVTWQPEGPDRF